MLGLWHDFLTAIQFLTRIPTPRIPFSETSLPRAVKFFPLVGAAIGALAAGLMLLLAPHLPPLVAAGLTIVCLLALTGCLHEDGLADTADGLGFGLGGGHTREQSLTIMRDSRIGTYGAAALTLSLVLRIALLAALSPVRLLPVVITAHMLCRWTTLPLSRFLPPARDVNDGQGARIARLTSTGILIGATAFSFTCAALLLRWHAVAPILAVVAVTAATGLYYRHRLGGVTGDCFGATNQLTEIAVLCCGVWTA